MIVNLSQNAIVPQGDCVTCGPSRPVGPIIDGKCAACRRALGLMPDQQIPPLSSTEGPLGSPLNKMPDESFPREGEGDDDE